MLDLLLVHGTNLALILVLAVVVVALWIFVPVLRWRLTSPLRKLPGPPSGHWLLGNLDDVYEARRIMCLDEWAEQHGPAIRFGGFLNSPTLLTMDTRAIHHILAHHEAYQKSDYARRNLARVVGEGLLIVEGKRHRLQRKIMNPAFGPAQIRGFTTIFVDKAAELREVWRDQITAEAQPSTINVLKGLSRVTLDAIGSAGFDCDIGALRQSDNVLTKAFEDIFNIPQEIPSIALLQTIFPPLEYISNNIMRRLDHAHKVMRRIGMQAIADRKAAVRGASADNNTEFSSSSQSKDLLTLLVKANLGTGGADDSRLSDEEILAQIPTFLSTGHESTSTATAWCLYSLAQAPRIQSKLRHEVLGVNTESPTMDDLVALPYLDMVVRETLRLHPPIASTMRVATKDDLIPLSTSYIDVHGQVCSSIRIAAGTPILIPILAMNTSRRYWGEDAHEFVPERWEHPPKATAAIPGVWSHMLTFLGGPRACIGYRLSLIEMKALIFTLLRTFEFSPAVDPADVRKMSGILHRPLLSKDGGLQSQLPLLVALAKSDRPV